MGARRPLGQDGPSAAPEVASRSRRAGEDRDVRVSTTQERLSNARRPRLLGCVFFAYFLLHKQKKVGRAPQAHETL
jgi:hypothetical protein